MIFDCYKDKVTIDGQEHSQLLNLNVNDVIDIVRRNSGYCFGVLKLYEGSVFTVMLDDSRTVTVGWGNRFLQPITNDEGMKVLWSKIYNEGEIIVGVATHEEIIDILQLSFSAVLLKPSKV